ncbi:uncharacterized protein LOC131311954 isoform X1 [Rhododendron vialii]|uniref:uncharacterized protein LOC131311954 isoform X1 n=1 Tax=Rhododendron vialii TaxID=182163 RepID=UPI00265EF76F|nr:uncharacterized protein LOC131311954 isoform X1 [Rhododendron vialii]
MTEVDGQEVFNLEDEAHVKLQKEQRPHKISFYVEKVYALKPRKAALENLQQRGVYVPDCQSFFFFPKAIVSGRLSSSIELLALSSAKSCLRLFLHGDLAFEAELGAF